MHRLAGAVVALCVCVPVASATLTPKKDTRFHADIRALIADVPIAEPEIVPTPGEAELTMDSQVYVNGKRCSYKDVPPNASIERIELDRDGKTIIRIEFRTRR
jgi:hypothetical protein